jgi:hypothetical protein
MPAPENEGMDITPTNLGPEWVEIGEVGEVGTYEDTTVTPLTEYSYLIVAGNEHGDADPTNVAHATTLGVLSLGSTAVAEHEAIAALGVVVYLGAVGTAESDSFSVLLVTIPLQGAGGGSTESDITSSIFVSKEVGGETTSEVEASAQLTVSSSILFNTITIAEGDSVAELTVQSPGGGWVEIGTVSNLGTFEDTTVSPSTEYSYVVIASNVEGDAAPTNVAYATTPGIGAVSLASLTITEHDGAAVLLVARSLGSVTETEHDAQGALLTEKMVAGAGETEHDALAALQVTGVVSLNTTTTAEVESIADIIVRKEMGSVAVSECESVAHITVANTNILQTITEAESDSVAGITVQKPLGGVGVVEGVAEASLTVSTHVSLASVAVAEHDVSTTLTVRKDLGSTVIVESTQEAVLSVIRSLHSVATVEGVGVPTPLKVDVAVLLEATTIVEGANPSALLAVGRFLSSVSILEVTGVAGLSGGRVVKDLSDEVTVLNPITSTYSNDQTISYGARYWDTTMTVPQKGVGFELFEVKSNAPKTPTDIMSALSTYATPVLEGKVGVVPNMYMYWGAGALPGVKTAGKVAIKFSGQITGMGTNEPVTLVFGGNGAVQVRHKGTSILSGVVHEPYPPVVVPERFTADQLRRDAGYQVVEVTVSDGDSLEVFYWQNGEPWGGVFGKVILGTNLLGDWNDFRSALMDAPIIGSSFVSLGAVAPTSIPYVLSAKVNWVEREVSKVSIEVALAAEGDSNGFYVSNNTGEVRLIDNANNNLVIKPNRRIQFTGGFVTEEELEQYHRFLGIIEAITPDAAGEIAVIQCSGVEYKLNNTIDENLPDVLAYHAHGLVDRKWLGYPVWGVAAFDAWPMEVVVADICYRAGVDAYNLGKSITQPNVGRRAFRKHSTGELVFGEKLFKARTLLNNEKLFLPRQPNYGNAGLLRSERLPPDDPYLIGAEVSERLLDRLYSIVHQYGYDFYFNAHGMAVIGARNNPDKFSPFVNIVPT